jgi:Protein of unknown function (DUF1488)
MPLSRHEIVGDDRERLAFKFSMLNEGQVVLCQISYAALDALAAIKTLEDGARTAQFVSLRDAVEQTASRLFDERPPLPGSAVKIFFKHVAHKPDQLSQSQTSGSETQPI